MKQISVLIAVLVTISAIRPQVARGGVISFDDLPSNPLELPIANGYADLNWNNFSYRPAVIPADPNSGFAHGVVSEPNVGFNIQGNPANISSVTAFTFNGAYLTGAWNNGLQVEVQGFQGTSLIDDVTVIAAPVTGPPEYFAFDFAGVTRLHFISFGGIQQPGLPGSGEEFAIDNLTVNEPLPSTPEPASVLLLGATAAALGVFLWRHRRACFKKGTVPLNLNLRGQSPF